MKALEIIRTLILVAALCRAVGLAAAETGAQQAPPTNSPTAITTEMLKAATDSAVAQGFEKLRADSDAASRRNAEALAARLVQIEQSLVTQHEREIRALQESNRTILMIVVGLVVVGLVAMSWAGLLMFRSVNRLVEITYAPVSRHLPSAQGNSLLTRAQETLLPAAPMIEPATSRVLQVLDQLQKRIEDMETVARAPLPPPARAQTGIAVQAPSGTTTTDSAREALSESRNTTASDQVSLLLEKGAAHLDLEQHSEALACFDEALNLNSAIADAHLKRGAALEKVNRFDEAISSYDRAIAINPSLTTAYLCKGSALNQLSRHEDAVRCYEEALRAGKS